MNEIVFLIYGVITLLEYDNAYSSHFISAGEKLAQFCEKNSQIREDNNLQPILLELSQAFSAYEKYNRVELVREVKKLFTDIEAHLNQFKISWSQCDLFEETLYHMAGITQLPKKSRTETNSYDRTRVDFYVTDMLEEDEQKFINLFLARGDDTAAKVQKGSRKMHQERCEEPQSAMVGPKIKQKTDHFQVDGELLAKKIFPEFKREIEQLDLACPEQLEPYQEQSKAYLQQLIKQLESAKKVGSVNNPSTLFHHSPTASSEYRKLSETPSI